MNLIFALVSLVICDQVSASPKFFDYLGGIESLKADFSQDIIVQDGVVLESSQGSLKIRKPNKYKWVYFSPMEQEIVCNGDKIWIHDPELEQVVERDTLDSDSNILDFIFEEPSVVAKTYSIKLLSRRRSKGEIFTESSREAPAIFEEIYVSFYNG